MPIELNEGIAEETFRRYGDRYMDPTDCMCPLMVVLKEQGVTNPGVCRLYWSEDDSKLSDQRTITPTLARFVYLVDTMSGMSWKKMTGMICLELLNRARREVATGTINALGMRVRGS